MASYKYEVVGADGKTKTGTIEAVNMEVASAELKSGGNTIVSIARANAFNKAGCHTSHGVIFHSCFLYLCIISKCRYYCLFFF